MKGKICGIIFVACMVLCFGIVGAIDNGAAVSNVLWCAPAVFVMWVSGRVGGFLGRMS